MAKKQRPKCPDCGKLLYRAKIKGVKVKKNDPYKYCHNEGCVRNTKKKKRLKPRPKKRKQVESESLKNARKTIRRELKNDESPFLLGMALLAQEMDFHEIANKLIDKYDLTGFYGILKKDEKISG